MKQTTIIFGYLIIAFVVYITLRNQLPDYLNLFHKKNSSVASSKADTSDPADNLKSFFGNAAKIIPKDLQGGVSDMISKVFDKIGKTQ